MPANEPPQTRPPNPGGATSDQGQTRQWSAEWTEYAQGQAPEWTHELIAAAREAWKSAWAPYSRFRVGAAALLDDGHILQASNQENASYPQGLCAERVLLFHIGAAFGERRIEALAIAAETWAALEGASDEPPTGGSAEQATGKTTDKAHHAQQAASQAPWLAPCGGCRQVLLESEQRQGQPMRIVLQHRDGRIGIWNSARDLLPLAFDGRMLPGQ